MFRVRRFPFFAVLFVAGFLSAPGNARAGAVIDCTALLANEPALARHYQTFAAFIESGYGNFLRLGKLERETIARLEYDLVSAPAGTSTAVFRKRLDEIPGLSDETRRAVYETLGLGEATTGGALEVYRKNYQYVFWSDHSARHMLEIVARSRELSTESPRVFLNYFSPTLDDPEWIELIDRAIHLHDSRMSVSRAQHAELLLDFDDATFPAKWSVQKKATAAILAMLHSKSTVPYASLGGWKSVVADDLLPKLVRDGLLSPEKAAIIDAALAGIDAADMARAAAWIRIADAARPIGGELRNSVGHAFGLTADERNAFLRTPKGDIPIPRSQYPVAYGQLALGNFRIKTGSGGKFILEFPFLIKGPYAETLRRDLERYDVVKSLLAGTAKADLKALGYGREAGAVAEILTSIVGDFPPELLRKIRVELK